MSNLVKINNQDLQVKELNGQRVVTFKDIDALHERVEGTAKRNFNTNKQHFIDKVDYFFVKPADVEEYEIRTSEINNAGTYLITESGYLMLVKSLNDDLAWKVQRELVNGYFRAKEQNISLNQLSPELQMFNSLFKALATNELEQKRLAQEIEATKGEVKEAKEEVQAIKDVITLNPSSWRTEVSNMLNKIAKERGGTQEAYREIRNESYKLLDERAGAKLEIRLTNRRRKVLEETGSRSKAEKVSKLDVIATDKRLTEVYLAIVKDMAIKYKS